MMLLLVVIAFTLLGLLQGLALFRQRHWRDLAVFGALWGVALVLSILIALQVPLPRLFVAISRLVRTIIGGSL